MNRLRNYISRFIGIFVIIFLAACSSITPVPDEVTNVRDKLSLLQSNAMLASRAPVEVNAAEEAVREAEKAQKDKELVSHLVLMADRKIDIAKARAESRLLVDQRKSITEQRENIRLDFRTLEADRAHRDASIARAESKQARMNMESERQLSDDLQKQIAELKAKSTERGLVITLGDLLFATGNSEIKGSAINNLDKLVSFLKKYSDRTATIEGHTDNVGTEYDNLGLSKRRADRVMHYLMDKGIDANRLSAEGKGESAPIADNQSASGRQQNRRVEVIIPNLYASSNF